MSLHIHKWVPTEEFVVDWYARHPQDMPYKERQRVYECSLCGKRSNYHSEPNALHRRARIQLSIGALGLVLLLVDSFTVNGSDISAIGWIGAVMIFPSIGFVFVLLTLVAMLAFEFVSRLVHLGFRRPTKS